MEHRASFLGQRKLNPVSVVSSDDSAIELAGFGDLVARTRLGSQPLNDRKLDIMLVGDLSSFPTGEVAGLCRHFQSIVGKRRCENGNVTPLKRSLQFFSCSSTPAQNESTAEAAWANDVVWANSADRLAVEQAGKLTSFDSPLLGFLRVDAAGERLFIQYVTTAVISWDSHRYRLKVLPPMGMENA